MAFKRLIGILALCASFFSASAQYNPYWQWAKADTLSALTYSGGPSVLGARNGKVLWGRITSGQTVINSKVMGGWTFTEYDSMGVKKNEISFGGRFETIDAQADPAGNWYILVHFYDSLKLPGQLLTRTNPATDPDPDYLMIRVNASSFVVDWFKQIGKLKTVTSHAFTIDNSQIIIAEDSTDATYIGKMSFANGTFTQMFRQGGTSTTSSIKTDAAGNIYIAGSCANKGSLDFNGLVVPLAPGTSNAYVASYLFNNVHAWHHIMNYPQCSQRKLSLFKDKFLYYTGTLSDTLNIGGVGVHPPLRSMDFISARLDPASGAVIWVHQVDTGGSGEAFLGTGAYHATVTPDTALVIFAQGNTYVNWGNNISTNLYGTYSSVVVSTGPAGDTRWARPILADNVTDDRMVSEGTAIYVAGNAFTNTAVTSFDTLNLKMPARRWVPYLGKLNLIRPPFVGPGGIGAVQNTAFNASPNPSRTAIRVAGLSGKNSLTLRDVNGRTVLEQNTDKPEAVLNVSELPRGTYFLQLRGTGDLPQVRKIVLQ